MSSTEPLPLENANIERIVIYPSDLDERTRHSLFAMLRKLGIHFEAGLWD